MEGQVEIQNEGFQQNNQKDIEVQFEYNQVYLIAMVGKSDIHQRKNHGQIKYRKH